MAEVSNRSGDAPAVWDVKASSRSGGSAGGSGPGSSDVVNSLNAAHDFLLSGGGGGAGSVGPGTNLSAASTHDQLHDLPTPPPSDRGALPGDRAAQSQPQSPTQHRRAVPEHASRTRAQSPVKPQRRVLPPNYVCPYSVKHGDNWSAQVLDWVNDVTGNSFPLGKNSQSLFEPLSNGQVLCELANTIRPGSVKRIERKEGPFQKRENVSRFISAAKALGVATNELFDPPDLVDGSNMNQVEACLFALGRACYDVPEYEGPVLGKPINHRPGAHKQSSFTVNDNKGLWGKAGGEHRPAAGMQSARMRPVTTTGRPEAPKAPPGITGS
mmetsp:Transcript_8864/g.24473  ORF Transcript_8864/g.24473 Transcript_8864/m.24473 type:complete len:326 (-) Transcript_8864:201-1178(-)